MENESQLKCQRAAEINTAIFRERAGSDTGPVLGPFRHLLGDGKEVDPTTAEEEAEEDHLPDVEEEEEGAIALTVPNTLWWSIISHLA